MEKENLLNPDKIFRLLTIESLLLCIVQISVFAQNTTSDPIKRQKVSPTGVRTYVEFNTKEKAYPINESQRVLHEYLPIGKQDEMREIQVRKGMLGNTHQKYQQYYKDIKVEYGVYQIHANQQGSVTSMSGKYYQMPSIDTSPTLTEEDALQAALSYVNADTYKWELPEEENWLKRKEENEEATYFPKGNLVFCKNFRNPDDESDIRLSYKFDVYAQEPLSRQYIYVDAHSGEIIHTNAILKEVHMHTTYAPQRKEEEGNAETRYSGSRVLNTTLVGDTIYILNDDSRGRGIETYNLENSGRVRSGDITGIRYSDATDFADNDNNWTAEEWDNNTFDNAALDAHWAAMMIYDYFLANHDRNGIDNEGLKMMTYIHAGTNYYNAFWDGEKVTIGDGDNNPLTSLDIVAHEYGHGIMDATAGLVYQNESGALNEGFSDIWAAAVESFIAPEKEIWVLGEDLNDPIRSMENPKIYGQPDTYFGENWYNGEEDNGGVHINSGVLNHWFYILSEGKTGTNDIGRSYSVDGIGIERAAQIAYYTLTNYLLSTSDYREAALLSIQATDDLFGETSFEAQQVRLAWLAVGIGGATFSASETAYCTAAIITFDDQSFNAQSWEWHFPGGQPTISTEQHPTVSYDTTGSFDVTLIITDAAGIRDTLVRENFISSSMVDLTEGEFITDLEGEDAAKGWESINANNDRDVSGSGYQWNYIDTEGGNARSGTGYFSYYGSSTSEADDWLFSNCFYLEESVVYNAAFWFRQRDASASQDAAFFLTSAQDTGMVVQELRVMENITNTSYEEQSASITVPATGIYYLAWHVYSEANQGNFYIDDISISYAEEYDIAINEVNPTVSGCDFTEETPVSISFANLGNRTLQNVAVNYTIVDEAGTPVLDGTEIIESLTPGQQVELSVDADLSEAGASYNVITELEALGEDNELITDSYDVTLQNQKSSLDLIITLEDDQLIASDGFTSYQWFYEEQQVSSFVGGRNQQYLPQDMGTYQVQAVNENGCVSLSESFLYQVTAVGEETPTPVTALSIYPNPTENVLNISLDNAILGEGMMEIYSIEGRLLKSIAFGKSEDEFLSEIDIRDLSAGIYFLNLNMKNYSRMVRILKK